MNLEFVACLEQQQAEARDWFADAMENGQAALAHITHACAADDPNTLKQLSPKHLDCVQRLALLKIHELTRAFQESKKNEP